MCTGMNRYLPVHAEYTSGFSGQRRSESSNLKKIGTLYLADNKAICDLYQMKLF